MPAEAIKRREAGEPIREIARSYNVHNRHDFEINGMTTAPGGEGQNVHPSDIYRNAVDSLKIGMEFFLKEDTYSSRKHAILTLFHSIELFLKEYLFRQNPILIYKNIDAKLTEEFSHR